MKLLTVLLFSLFCSTVAFAQSGDIRCDGSLGGVSGVSVVLGSRLSPGDVDNGYAPYCIADARLLADSAILSHGDLLSEESDGRGEVERVVVSFSRDALMNTSTGIALAQLLQDCSDAGVASGSSSQAQCLVLTRAAGQSGAFVVNGNSAQQLSCRAADTDSDDCQQ